MKLRSFYRKHQDKIELSKAYLGLIVFTYLGIISFGGKI